MVKPRRISQPKLKRRTRVVFERKLCNVKTIAGQLQEDKKYMHDAACEIEAVNLGDGTGSET